MRGLPSWTTHAALERRCTARGWGVLEYRVGDYRLICKIEDDRLVVLFLRIGDRQESYR
jgi:mRNA interferase RelE/StbE